ncbi:MAG: tetratricopeptide repeat protein [Sphingomonadaceae bacterium]
MNAGDLARARQKMLTAIGIRDDIAVQWLVLGRIDLQLNRPLDALNDYNRVIELDATNAEALQIVAEMSFQTGQLTEATTAADRILALDPNATRALLVKGMVALDQKKPADAVTFADQLLAISPNDELGNVLRARILAIGGNFGAARALIDANIPPGSRTEATLSTIVEIERAEGDPARLTAAYEALLASRSKDVALRIEFAQFLYKIANAAKARTLLFDFINQNPNSINVMQTVRATWLDNDPDPLTPAQLAQIAKAGSVTVRTGVARYLLARDRASEALAILSAGARGGTTEARSLYAMALYATGKVQDAKAIIDDILETDRANNDALLVRGRMALAGGNLSAALGDIQIVVSDDPQNLQALALISDILVRRGEARRATQAYESAIRDAPLTMSVTRDYSQLLRRMGNKARGLSVARDFTIRSPGSVAGWDNYAAQCRFFGEPACAAAAARGRALAVRSFKLDERPGSVSGRGLFGALS